MQAKEKPKARELAYWYPFNVDQWYPQVRDLTFHSEFIHLTEEEARELIDIYDPQYFIQNAASIEPTPYDEQRALAHPLLSKIEREIETALSKFEGRHAFVRLSSRSPKDAILGNVVDQYLDDEMRRFLKAGGQPTLVNMHPLVYVASAKALEVRSGKEALHLLLNSFRVLEDLNYYINNPTVFPVCITLREWVDIPPSMEFRGFVCENQFTAMSQYFYESYFEDLVKTKKEVKKRVIEFWQESVKEKLQYLQSYVIDFAVVGDRVWVLELNPFVSISSSFTLTFASNDAYTGTGLFSWEGHNQRLTKGPFKFAILKSPLTHGNVWINAKLRKSLDRIRSESDFSKLNLNLNSLHLN